MGDSGYQAVGNASDVQNINAGKTNDFYQQLLGRLQGAQGEMAGRTAPANIATIQGVAPGIQNMVQQLIDPYSAQRMTYANQLAEQTGKAISQQYGNAGAGTINSGAFGSALARGMSGEIGRGLTEIEGLRQNLTGNILNQMQGQLGQEYQTQAGLMGQMLGQLGQMAAPEYWQPTYQYKQGMGDILLKGGLGLGGSLLGSLLGPMGTAAGGAAGNWLGNLLTPRAQYGESTIYGDDTTNRNLGQGLYGGWR